MMMKNSWTDHDVETHWDNVAEIYVSENARVKGTHDQRFREAVQYLALKPGMKILNITSRDAEATDHILRYFPEAKVINGEISQGLIEVAAKLRPSVNQVKLNSYSFLPFEKGEFQRILSLETLEHVADPLLFLGELHRVSTPDARLVLSCPPATSEFPYRVYTALFGGHGEGPHRFPSSKEVKRMLTETQWKLMVHKGTLLVPVGPDWLKNLGEELIGRMQGTFIAELGIRQFYVCEKA